MLNGAEPVSSALCTQIHQLIPIYSHSLSLPFSPTHSPLKAETLEKCIIAHLIIILFVRALPIIILRTYFGRLYRHGMEVGSGTNKRTAPAIMVYRAERVRSFVICFIKIIWLIFASLFYGLCWAVPRLPFMPSHSFTKRQQSVCVCVCAPKNQCRFPRNVTLGRN